MELSGENLNYVITVPGINTPAQLVRVEDSGNGFDHKGNNGTSLLYELTESLYYYRSDHCAETIIGERV